MKINILDNSIVQSKNDGAPYFMIFQNAVYVILFYCIIQMHPGYRFPDNDIAVVELADPITMPDSARKAVVLPNANDELADREDVMVSGWGLTMSNGKSLKFHCSSL